ncbi:protein of unknown function [Kyrpidia spormannii]|uniref:Uncharacterized protein n=1 Tax=Kyrpidia spormannii TaxID=2055160 RepID=A0A6F9EC19_9BACL|nr:protein of unknown function [Kyrpidia spormannii]
MFRLAFRRSVNTRRTFENQFYYNNLPAGWGKGTECGKTGRNFMVQWD